MTFLLIFKVSPTSTTPSLRLYQTPVSRVWNAKLACMLTLRQDAKSSILALLISSGPPSAQMGPSSTRSYFLVCGGSILTAALLSPSMTRTTSSTQKQIACLKDSRHQEGLLPNLLDLLDLHRLDLLQLLRETQSLNLKLTFAQMTAFLCQLP